MARRRNASKILAAATCQPCGSRREESVLVPLTECKNKVGPGAICVTSGSLAAVFVSARTRCAAPKAELGGARAIGPACPGTAAAGPGVHPAADSAYD